MRKTKYTVKYTTGFKKDYKRAIKRGLKIELLEQVVALLAMGEPLPEKNRDHDLSGDWVGHRECHILPLIPSLADLNFAAPVGLESTAPIPAKLKLSILTAPLYCSHPVSNIA